MATATLVSRPVAILAMVFLARLLDPADFGAIALAMVLFSTARLFSGLGMDNALIHNRRDISATGFQAFAITCVSSLVLFMVVNLGVDGFAKLLGNVELASILQDHIKSIKIGSPVFGPAKGGYYSNFSQVITAKFKKYTGRALTANLLRHSFITDFLSKKRTTAEKKETALQMGHNIGSQGQYLRIDL